MTVNTGDILRVTAKMEIAANAVQNVYHAQISGGPVTDTDAFTAMANAMDASYVWLHSGIPTALLFTEVEVWNVTQGLPVGTGPWPGLVAGLAAGDVAPFQLAFLVKFDTKAPRSQGRKYLPPTTETFLDTAGQVTAAYVTMATNYANALVGGVVLPTIGYIFGNWNATLARFAPWDSAVLDNFLATQRRRRPGVGI